MRVLRHALAICLLPGTVVLLVPAVLVALGGTNVGWSLPGAFAALPVVLGAGLLAIGAALVISTIVLFVRVGRGTLAPWDPTKRLVVKGPYRRVRNPMISGVLFLLLGEAMLLGSPALLAWFGGVALVNAIYLPLVEEPGLVRRYGSEYEQYRAAVPRWVPRARAWTPAREGQPPP